MDNPESTPTPTEPTSEPENTSSPVVANLDIDDNVANPNPTESEAEQAEEIAYLFCILLLL